MDRRMTIYRYSKEKSKVHNSVHDILFSSVCCIFFCVKKKKESTVSRIGIQNTFGEKQKGRKWREKKDRKENFL